jgi:plastocyanin
VGGIVVLTSTTSTSSPALILRDRHVCGVEGQVLKGWLHLDGRNLNGVMIHLETPPQRKRIKPSRIQIDQKNCMYLPRVVGVASGSKVRFTNSDPVLHNVHLFDPENRTVANWAMPAKAQTTNWITLKKPGLHRVGCDAGHAWMNAHIFVFDHPHFVLSDGGGKFALKNVPAGRHRLLAWHPDLGAREAAIVVPQKGRVEVRVEF